MSQKQIDSSIKLAGNHKVFEDKKTRVKTVAVKFIFPDYTAGIVSITKLTHFPWTPEREIESITINYKNDDNNPTA